MEINFKDTKEKLMALKNVIQNMMPVNEILGFEIDVLEEGLARLKVPFKKEFIGDFRRGLWHGGVLASIADTAGGLVAMSLAQPHDSVNTIDMRIDYLHGAINEDVFVESNLVKSGKRIIIADVKIYQKQKSEPIVVARCAYSILRK